MLDADSDGDQDIYFANHLGGEPPYPEDKPSGILLNDGGVLMMREVCYNTDLRCGAIDPENVFHVSYPTKEV